MNSILGDFQIGFYTTTFSPYTESLIFTSGGDSVDVLSPLFKPPPAGITIYCYLISYFTLFVTNERSISFPYFYALLFLDFRVFDKGVARIDFLFK